MSAPDWRNLPRVIVERMGLVGTQLDALMRLAQSADRRLTRVEEALCLAPEDELPTRPSGEYAVPLQAPTRAVLDK